MHLKGMRREVARLSIEKLIADGRIHPARIEEIVEKSRKEVEAFGGAPITNSKNILSQKKKYCCIK